MKMILASIALGVALAACTASPEATGEGDITAASKAATTVQAVKPGIEVLRESGFEALKGKKVGLITNPTGIDNNLVSTIDILHAAPDVTLAALFAPEHGVRGDYHAGASVADAVDPATGVKVYSLHGRNRKPTPEMLRGLDALVYDIQDIGCRSYTFISTMGLAMQAAAEAGIEFVVLDRPNPLGGDKVEGPGVDADCISFVSQYDIPYLYGLTPGELANYFNGSGVIKGKLKLTVIPMEGWQRSMTFADTGMPWVLPSPHIPDPSTALLYPATGIMGELDYVSIGVGYTLPFKLTGATWIDADRLCEALRADSIPGVDFRPIHYNPFYGSLKGQNVNGVEIYVTDMEAAPLSLVQFYIMQELARLYPTHKAFASATAARLSMFDKVCGSKKVRSLFGASYSVDSIRELWTGTAEAFKEKSRPYRLYE